MENKQIQIEKEGKRKMAFSGQTSQGQPRPRMVQSPMPYFRPSFAARPPGQASRPQFQAQRPNFQMSRPNAPTQRPNSQAPQATAPQAPRPPAPASQQMQNSNAAPNSGTRGPCFSCGGLGHFANKCPQRKQTPYFQPTGGSQGQQNYAYGKVNHVTTGEA